MRDVKLLRRKKHMHKGFNFKLRILYINLIIYIKKNMYKSCNQEIKGWNIVILC